MGVEIERKYLLRGAPPTPPEARKRTIEQGYVQARHVPADHQHDQHILEARIRRAVHEDGTTIYTRTVKRGFGMVREEIEDEVDAQTYAELWPMTEGMRLRKTRWLWNDGEAEWAIDVFDDIELALAEVEVPSEEYDIEIPRWLEQWIERDVTDERAYVNSEIARRIGQDDGS